jgi:hypothetical protein
MRLPGFDTPEAAAMEGFPPAYVRIVAMAQDGDDAFVVLDTGPAAYRYLYAGTVHRDGGRWYGGIDGNAVGGWTVTDQDAELGVVTLWDEAPPDADAVRVRWRGEEREVPVTHGVYLAVWWREPWPEDSWPAVAAFRVGDQWVALPER